MKIFKYLLLFLLQIAMTFICVFFVIVFIENYVGIATTSAPMDSVSLANTFMVFVTFILVGVTLVITLASIWFAKKVSEEKIAIIKANIKELVESLLENKELQNDVFKEIIRQTNGEKLLKEHVTELIEAQKNTFDIELEKTTSKMNDDFETATAKMNDDFDNIKKSIISMFDKKIQDSAKANELNELFGGKK